MTMQTCAHTAALARLERRAEQLAFVPCARTWQRDLQLLVAEVEDYVSSAPLPSDVHAAFGELHRRLKVVASRGWHCPPALICW